jgi:hypothetical protein
MWTEVQPLNIVFHFYCNFLLSRPFNKEPVSIKKMIMRIVLLLLFILPGNVIQAQTGTVSLPFKTYNNLIFLKVSVNGSKNLHFLFDTGASGCVLNEKTSKMLGLKTSAGDAATTGGGDVEAAYAKNVILALTPVARLEKLTIAVIDLSGLESTVGEPIDGIVGYEAFEKWVVRIDYQAKLISLTPKEEWHYKGDGEMVRIKIQDNLPYTNVTLLTKSNDSITAKLLVDIGGASNDIRLNTFYVGKHRLTEINAPTLPLTYGAINAGKATGEIGRMKGLRVGTYFYPRPLVNFSTSSQGEETDTTNDGILNAPFLSHFTCIFDYSREYMILEKKPSISSETEFDMSGISLLASGNNLNVYTVRLVLNNSPASAEGILKGDVIVAINGAPASKYSLSEIRKMLSSKPGTIITLQVKRKTQVFIKKIALKKLV